MYTTTETPSQVREKQAIIPDWMADVLEQAEQDGDLVEVTRYETLFGDFVISISPVKQDVS
jgi:hypothetical protein